MAFLPLLRHSPQVCAQVPELLPTPVELCPPLPPGSVRGSSDPERFLLSWPRPGALRGSTGHHVISRSSQLFWEPVGRSQMIEIVAVSPPWSPCALGTGMVFQSVLFLCLLGRGLLGYVFFNLFFGTFFPDGGCAPFTIRVFPSALWA